VAQSRNGRNWCATYAGYVLGEERNRGLRIMQLLLSVRIPMIGFWADVRGIGDT